MANTRVAVEDLLLWTDEAEEEEDDTPPLPKNAERVSVKELYKLNAQILTQSMSPSVTRPRKPAQSQIAMSLMSPPVSRPRKRAHRELVLSSSSDEDVSPRRFPSDVSRYQAISSLPQDIKFDIGSSSAGDLDDDGGAGVRSNGFIALGSARVNPLSMAAYELQTKQRIERYKFKTSKTKNAIKGRKVPQNVSQSISIIPMTVAYAQVCMCCISKFDEYSIGDSRKKFLHARCSGSMLTSGLRGQMVLDAIYSKFSSISREHSWEGVEVCTDCFCHINSISRSMYQKCEGLYFQNKTSFVDGRSGRLHAAPKADTIQIFLSEYFGDMADPIPDSGHYFYI